MFKIGLRLFKGLILFILCLQLATGGGLASDVPKTYQPAKETKAGEHSYNLSKVRLGASASTEDRGIFYIDYLLPLFYSEDQNTLFFINPKQSWFTPHSSDEINIGAGIRHIFNDKFILGMHSFYDKKDSITHKLYSQVGWGFEFLSQPFDFRFNYYDPHTKAKVVESGTSYKFGSLTLIEISSKTYEEPLEGFDFEVGFPIIPKQLKTRVYFGGFFFDSKMAKDYNGFRARTETDLNNWLAIDTTFNSWGKGETEFVGGFRVTIPLELGRTLSKKNPLKTTPRDTYIKDRLFERVVRDIDVQARTTPTIIEEEPARGSGGDIIEIIYVDNSNTGGDGTLEHPYTAIGAIGGALGDSRYVGQGGTAKYIYVFKGDSETIPYSGNYVLADDTTIWGSNTTLGYAGLSTYGLPVIDGGWSGSVFTLGNDNTIAGAKITNGTDGIYAENKTGGTIKENTISDNTNYGIYIYNQDNNISDWTIEDNTIENNSNYGILIENQASGGNTSTVSSFTISDNTLTDNTNGGMHIYNYADNSGSSDMSGFTINGNTVSGDSDYGIYMENIGNSGAATASDFTIDGNILTGGTTAYYPYFYSQNGIHINNSALNSGTAEISSEFNITGNTISNYQGEGIYIHNLAYTYGFYAPAADLSGFTVSGNTIENNGEYGILINNINFWNCGTADISDFTIQDNDILNNEHSGIELYNSDGTVQNMDILDNIIQDNGMHGISLRNSGGSFTDFTMEDNFIQNNGSSGNYDGIYLETDNGADIFTFRDNTITGNTGNGINLQLQGGDVSGFTFDSNTIESNQGNSGGIYIYNNGSTVSDFDFTGNIISNNTNSNGIYIYNSYWSPAYSTMSDFTFSGNTIQNNGGSGIYICNYSYSYHSYVSDFSFSGNTITGNSGDGVRFYEYYGYYIYNMDLGGGAMYSTGNNSLYDNDAFDLNTNTNDTVSAQSNWWGDTDPSDQVSGNVDYSNPLPSPP